ncbi:nicotinate phosphoribosyltransferase [Rhodococcus sp. IEGM 1408]|uniref:nicotinate phosphoribosyltransferase n=1 Tax=Rhodococcus sp. IEGM 1408 TaxID=3082220 RepID=UPI002955B06F|nr:nicotinate phosphoribosyltransferase [Rhodococcus sp. IEGM 1408]MDV8000810.1 nicotinate phosphoribosyltransferase [Rhodococcus sp. IEGM 1408]
MNSTTPPHASDSPGRPSTGRPSTALLTDKYELTMIRAALADGTADRPCVFEVFARRLPAGRRYGVVAGIGRLIERLADFRFGDEEIAVVAESLDKATTDWLRAFRFTGDVDGYPEGELFFPGSPVLSIRGGFAECVVLETLVLSVLNHDSAIASAAARMTTAAGGRPIIEMGSRRTHEEAAVAAARASYLTGFASTSNIEATRRHGVPSAGTSAHAFILLHTGPDGTDEASAFRSQVATLGVDTTLLVDTYDITRGVETAIEVAGPELGGVRIDSGDLGVLASQVRGQLDALGAHRTQIVVSGDLDEYAIAALRAEPVDVYGVGTRLVTGSGAPTAGMVYKLVEVDGIPVAKRSAQKESLPGAKRAVRVHRRSGTAVEEILLPWNGTVPAEPGLNQRDLMVPLVRGGDPVPGLPSLDESRAHHEAVMVTLPWAGLALSQGDPAISVRVVPPGTPPR